MTVKDVTDALLVGTSSSRYVAKNYWRDPKSGVDYQVQVQVPTQRMNRPQQVETLPLQESQPRHQPDGPRRGQGADRHHAGRDRPQRHAALPEHHGQRRGRATSAGRPRRIDQAIAAAGEPPRGVRVSVRGQVAPMTEMFDSLTVGLALSVVVILVLLTGYFQSFRLGLISIGGRAGRGLRRGHHPAGDGHHAEHRVVHGLDHVHRRLGVELGAAVDLHGRPLAGRGDGAAGRRRRGQGPACARS